MPRYYKKKTNREFSSDSMKRAVDDVLRNNISIRASAQKNNVTKSRLFNYIKRAKDQGIDNMIFEPDFQKSLILSSEMESELEKYLVKCSTMFYGLTPKSVTRLAYEYAAKNGLSVPRKWQDEKMAGSDWFSRFMHRHPRLSIRKPEATGLARMTSFNKATVKVFQDKLEAVITRYSFTASQIFNLDETGVTTVQRVQKIVGKKGEHQIGQATSRERGELITQVGIICANGNALPPVWIFPRHRFDPARMMKGIVETGPLGLVYPSGWMTCENFLKVLSHFVKNVNCSTDNKVLLIMDNLESHLSVEAIDFCRNNGIIILTLPPHTSNKLQPLDRTVFGPFKTFFNQFADSWMLSHPGKTLTIYDLPLMCLQSWDRAANPVNIKSGFRCTGIVPFDRSVFSEENFLCSAVTDRPLIQDVAKSTSVSDKSEIELSASTSVASLHDESSTPRGNMQTNVVTPDMVRPYPLAPPRKEKSNNKGRKRGRCMIATETPEKLLLEEKINKKTEKLTAKKKRGAKRKVFEDESSDKERVEIDYQDNSSDDSLIFDENREKSVKEASKGDYIIVNVYGKSSVRKYVAMVDDTFLDGYEVKFLKRNSPSNRFKFTNEPPATIYFEDVLLILPKPIKEQRPRFDGMIYFNVLSDLSECSLQ